MVQKRQIGDRLHRILEERSMSIYKLHKEVEKRTDGARGSSYSGLRHYVTGAVKRPRPDIIEAAAHALGVDPEWLLTGEGSPHLTADQVEAELDRAEEEAERDLMERADAGLDAAVDRAIEAEDRRQRSEGDLFSSVLLESSAARAVFRVAWARLADGCQEPDMEPEEMNAVGRLLLAQLEAPLNTWGYRENLVRSRRDLDDYVIGMLHCLMTAMSHPRRGDSISALLETARE